MKDSYKNKNLDPVKLSSEWLDFANEVNNFFDKYYPNYLFDARRVVGSIFHNLRAENIADKDRVQTIASKIRGFLYPIFSNKIAKSANVEIQILNIAQSIGTKYFSKKEVPNLLSQIEKLRELNSKIMDLDHYCINVESDIFETNPRKCRCYSLKDIQNDLEILRKLFPIVKLLTLITHQVIDAIIAKAKTGSLGKKDKESLDILLESNDFDAKNYFYAKADERWLSWLWKNGFLDVIKQKAKDSTRYGYRTPELRYLVRMVEKKSVKVAEIVSSKGTATTGKKFNPEVVDQFLRISSQLPARELKKIIPKIKKENWVKLMNLFSPYGFEYTKMFETLYKAGEISSLLELAELVLVVKTKKELEEKTIKFGGKEFPVSIDNPFYFKDFSYVEVFDYLAKINDEKYIQKAFGLVTETMAKVIKVIEFNKGKDKDGVFSVNDNLLLLDEDFFDIDLKKRSISPRENIINLAAVMKILAERFATKYCQSKPEKAKKFFNKYIGTFDNPKAPLPDSKAVWHFRLFVLSSYPKVFKNELKKSFDRLFDVKRYYLEIISGTEYKKALQKGFTVLSNNDKREYVKKVIKYFKRKNQERKNEKENWHLKYGSQILSVIYNQLTEGEKKLAKEAGLKLDLGYKPKPSIGPIESGMIVPKAPITQEEFHDKSINEIVRLLKTKWTPENLRKKNKSGDSLRPFNAEGAGEQLKKDIPTRFQEYIDKAPLFFEREKLDPHYTYSFLSEIWEYIRNNRDKVTNINWEGLIDILIAIKQSGENKSFGKEKRDRKTFDVWLANWIVVHSAIADVIQELLREQSSRNIIDFPKYREKLFEIIKHLLAYPDPIPEDEKLDTAGMKTKSPSDENYLVSDPFTMAINSVRGRAFQDFVLFVYQDGKRFKKEDKIKITEDVKDLYEEVLEKENTRALMFMFGHYLPSFYFRNKEWIRKLLSKIFPIENKYLYTASWEGYLSTNLYKDMFFDSDIRKLYEKALDLTDKDYPKQKHFKDPDEALADHLALAFVHFSEFDFEYPLFKKFLERENIKRQKEFISFIGRHTISREFPNEWIKYNKVSKKKLKDFWSWVLKNPNLNSEILAGFGFWINPKEEVITDEILAQKMAKTLYKSEGQIDWDYGLIKRLPKLAKTAPSDLLEIIRNYLLDEENNLNPNRRIPLLYTREIKSALEIIHKNGDREMKQKIFNLINILIEKGSSMFWELEDIIDKK